MSEQHPPQRPDEPGQPPQHGQDQPPQQGRPGGQYPPSGAPQYAPGPGQSPPSGGQYPPPGGQYPPPGGQYPPPGGAYPQASQYPQAPGPGYGRELSPADQRMWGMLAHVSGLVTGLFGLTFLGPLIVYLVYKDRGGFVRRQSAEALNFQILLNVVALVTVVLSVITLGIALVIVVPLWIVIGIGAIVLMIVAAVKANNGEDYRYPVNWRLVR